MKFKPMTLPKPVIFLTFLIGFLCALCFRSIIVLQKTGSQWVRPVWYFATIGYIYFFAYRFIIAYKRRKLIQDRGLISKLENHEQLSEEEHLIISYLLSSLIKPKESLNYLIIFILSVVAIFLDLVVFK